MYTWALNILKIGTWEFLYINIKIQHYFESHCTFLTSLWAAQSSVYVQVDSFEQSAEEVKVWNKTE